MTNLRVRGGRMIYKNICKAILKKSKGKDYRPLLRRWVKIFEDTRVVGWNRDEFLECMIECRKEEIDVLYREGKKVKKNWKVKSKKPICRLAVHNRLRKKRQKVRKDIELLEYDKEVEE